MAQPPPPHAAVSKVSKATVTTAITALLKHKATTNSAADKLQLLPSDDFIYLNLTLKRIPSNSRTNPFRIQLPHPIFDQSSHLCLIIDDRAKTPTPPSDQIKKLIKSNNIPIEKVIKLSKLKANYKSFESKRKLCDSYDMFLVDKRVVHLLPKLIGKEFFKKKKLPLGVDLGKKNLGLQVERVLGSGLLYFRTGTCCVMKVGKVSMEVDEIVENVVEAIEGVVGKVPKKWEGVRSLGLKFYDSVLLPVYQAMPDVKLRIEGLKEVERRAELTRGSDSEGEVKELRGSKEGKSGKKKKGRIHEVRYMDGVEIDEDDLDVDESELVKGEENGELVGVVMEEIDDDDDECEKIEEEVNITETVGKKRNKRGALKEQASEVSNEKKRVKKNAKADKAEEKPKKSTIAEKIEEKKPKKNVIAEKTEEKPKKFTKAEKVEEKKPKKNVIAEKTEDKKPKRNAKAEKIEVEKKPKKNVIAEKTEDKKPKRSAKAEKVEEKNPKNIELPVVEKSGEKKGNKKSELGKRQSERIAKAKDTKPKKRVSAK